MRRVWDISVGCFMVFASLVFQVIFLGIPSAIFGMTIANYFKIKSDLFVWWFGLMIAAIYNGATLFEFRRNRIVMLDGNGSVSPKVGVFFLLPRGVCRILYGREMPHTSKTDTTEITD
jgi:hypothetical protein